MWNVDSGTENNPVRAFILIVATVGTLLFGSLFVLSIASPISIERWARTAIEHEVEKRAGEDLHALSETSLVRRAKAVIEKNKRDSAFDRILFAVLHNEVEHVVARMQDVSCECRKRVLKFIDETAGENIRRLGSINAHLTNLIESKYAQVSQSLIREVRIFSAANALVFVTLGLVTLLRRDSRRSLLAPTFVLLASASVVGYFYLFRQDWMQTILFNDYVGMWYFGYLGIAMAFLADIVLNKGRVTAIFISMFAGAAPVSPC